jgi:transposase
MMQDRKDTREKKIQPKKSVCALDPGVRTFQTLYSPEGVVKFQQNMERINELHDKIDQLKSLRATSTDHKTSVRCRRDYRRAYRHLGWLIDELHYSTIHELKNYKHILLPRFDSQEMVRSRKLDRKTKRRMMALQHYRFRQRLEDWIDLNPDTKLYIVNESYTTKTCTRCGVINDVGSNSIYHCLECGLYIERDINGARNILLKNLKQI